jgi:hypothetical protein
VRELSNQNCASIYCSVSAATTDRTNLTALLPQVEFAVNAARALGIEHTSFEANFVAHFLLPLTKCAFDIFYGFCSCD